jgi:nucleotide-binding universal stress UspA family protein
MLQVGTILHPTDFSENSKTALSVACALARDYGARLVILHVAHVPNMEGYQTADPVAVRNEAESLLDSLQLPIETVRAERLCKVVELGETDATIVSTAKDLGADVIVLGTHGRTGLRRLLMGSIAEHVVRESPCLVLTVSNKMTKDPVAVK